MGNLGKAEPLSEGRWFEAPDVIQLKMSAEAWRDGASKDRRSNRLFLDLFSVFMVKHFRTEEVRLKEKNAPDQAWHREEHLRLVQQIWALISDEQLGLEVTDGIHQLLEAWFLHQEAAMHRQNPKNPITH